MTETKLWAGVFIAFILLGVYAWFDQNRTLECRTNAMSTMTAEESIRFCKR